jgi:hypothetical protein
MAEDEADGPGVIKIPGFQTGGLVRETGIALVHEGEYIMPAPGSEATIEPAQVSDQGVINYYFPVEIVFVGSLPEAEREAIEASIWERLGEELTRLA